jgi:hypothetical protein
MVTPFFKRPSTLWSNHLEAGRHHPNDGERFGIETHGAAKQTRVGTESPSPHSIAQDDDSRSARTLLSRQEKPS